MKKLLLFCFFCLSVRLAISQSITISGFIVEGASRERLNGAVVTFNENRLSVVSNETGYFSIRGKKTDSIVLKFSHAGYENRLISFQARSDTFFIVDMTPQFKELSEIKIQGRGTTDNNLSAINIPVKTIERIPALFGEKDIVRAIQLLPGVQSGGEGSTGYYVRGGGADQNLILLDGVTIYNVSHLFGFLSLFPTEAVKSVELIKGGFPARYGGRLSSVLDIKLKDGNKEKITGDYSIGLLSAKGSIEGPLKKGKSSFILTARRTYIDALLKPLLSGQQTQGGYFFYDGIAKLNFNLTSKSSLSFSVYAGKDKLNFVTKDSETSDNGTVKATTESKVNYGWGNFAAAIRLTNTISSHFNINSVINYTSFGYNLGYRQTGKDSSGANLDRQNFTFSYLSSVKDINVKSTAYWYLSNKINIVSGISYTHHFFVPSSTVLKNTQNPEQTVRRFQTNESFIFSEVNLNVTSRLVINAGVHAMLYSASGKDFFSLQPRIRTSFEFPDRSGIQFSFATMKQPIHLLTNNGPGLPTDLWVPATPKVPPQNSIQFTLGYRFKPVKDYELSVETYYKKMKGVIEYSEGASFLTINRDWENKVEIGKGESYGSEIFLQKKSGILSGWIGYTLSWNKRRFENLNNGEWFWYKYDHRNDFKIVAIYQLSKKIDLSMSFVLHSGNKITIPDIVYTGAANASPNYNGLYIDTDPSVIYNSSSRNNISFKTYHRGDIGINFNKERKRGTRTWNISVYNFYNRLNTYFIYYRTTVLGSPTLVLYDFTLFPILPSISYQFKWK